MHVKVTRYSVGWGAIVVAAIFSVIGTAAGYYIMLSNPDKFPLATENNGGVQHYTWNTTGVGLEWLYHAIMGEQYKIGIDGL